MEATWAWLLALVGVGAAVIQYVSSKSWRGRYEALSGAQKDDGKKRDDAEKKLDSAQSELRKLKDELREEKAEHKALKKKRWDAKKPSEPTVVSEAAPSVVEKAPEVNEAPEALDQHAMEQQVRALNARLGGIEGERARWQAEAEQAQKKLQMVESQLTASKDKGSADKAAIENELKVLKGTRADEQKAMFDARRKAEWHRRIYVVQRAEIGTLKDKMGHVRRRFLDVCADLVKAQRGPNVELQKEVDGLKREEAAYQSQIAKAEAGALDTKTEPAKSTPADASQTLQ